MTGTGDRPASAPAPIIGVTSADLDRAAAVIRLGGCVAMPTETVYGLAADAADARAITRIYEAKGRPRFNPLICHVTGVDMAAELAILSPLAAALMARFWPGPLTLVLPRRPHCPVSDLALAGLPTIALRVPKHPAATGLIARVARPLAAPSANLSEQLSPTTALHVAAGIGARIDLILDGGPCVAGLESTIVAPVDDRAILLRPGALARTEIESVTGPLLAADAASGVIAPGMLRRHYAPRAHLRLGASDAREGEAFLGFGAPPDGVTPTLNLSARGDLAEAATNLFAMLHRLDASHAAIAVAPIPDSGLGEGINDRLKRAAALAREDSV